MKRKLSKENRIAQYQLIHERWIATGGNTTLKDFSLEIGVAQATINKAIDYYTTALPFIRKLKRYTREQQENAMIEEQKDGQRRLLIMSGANKMTEQDIFTYSRLKNKYKELLSCY